MTHHHGLASVALLTGSILLISLSPNCADNCELVRHSAVNLSLSLSTYEQTQFTGVRFGYMLDEVFYAIAYSYNISAPLIDDWARNSDYFRGRLRSFMEPNLDGSIVFIVELSDLKFSDSTTFSTRWNEPGFETRVYCRVFGPPEECGNGLSMSRFALGASFHVYLTLCAYPQPTSISFTYGGITSPATYVESNSDTNFTYVFVIPKLYVIAPVLRYEAENTNGRLVGSTLLKEDKYGPICSIENGYCEQICVDLRCSCYLGTLKDDGRKCSEHDFLAIGFSSYIFSVNAKLTTNVSLISPYPNIYGPSDLNGLDYNYESEVFYYADKAQGALVEIGLDGSGKRVLKSGLNEPSAVAYDWVRNQIYWVEEERSGIRRLDVNTATDILMNWNTEQTLHVQALALRPQASDRLIFWSSVGLYSGILRSSLDSLNAEYIVGGTLYHQPAYCMTIDHENKLIYWVRETTSINRCDFKGNNRLELTFDIGRVYSIQLFNGFLYWTDSFDEPYLTGLYRASLADFEPEIVYTTSKLPVALVAFTRRTTDIDPETPKTSKSTSAGLIGGVVVGAVVFALVVVGLMALLVYKRRRMRAGKPYFSKTASFTGNFSKEQVTSERSPRIYDLPHESTYEDLEVVQNQHLYGNCGVPGDLPDATVAPDPYQQLSLPLSHPERTAVACENAQEYESPVRNNNMPSCSDSTPSGEMPSELTNESQGYKVLDHYQQSYNA